MVSRDYQLLARHAVIGFYLHESARVAEPSECCVVQQRREAVVLSSVRRVPDLGAAAEETAEMGGEVLWMGAPQGPSSGYGRKGDGGG